MIDTDTECSISGEKFVISSIEQKLLNHFGLPAPTISPLERHRRRLSHRNEDSLYVRNCDLTGARMVSIFPAETPYAVYSQAAWWSDDWHGSDYGIDVDFNRPFLEQFADLQKRVPRLGLMNGHGENSEYCHNCFELKNCYLVFGGDYAQDSYYSYYNDDSSDVVDVYRVKKSELVYDSSDCSKCYNVKYCRYSVGCIDSQFLLDCSSCNNCTGCVGLHHAQFCFLNEQLSEADYLERVSELALDSWSGVEKFHHRFSQFCSSVPRKAAWLIQAEDCSGNRIVQAKNCLDCFDLSGPAQDLAHVYSCGSEVKDVASSNNLGKVELMYEIMSGMESYSCALSLYCWTSSNAMYCDTVSNCKDVFGCCSLRGSNYSILNKSYTKHEYQNLRAKLIDHMKETGEWGRSFSIEQSPFAYNETLAYSFFPLERSEIESKGWKWAERNLVDSGESKKLPDSLKDVTGDVLDTVAICESSGKAYKFIAKEIEFYRKMNIPLPRLCFEERTRRKLSSRGGLTLFNRKCCSCQKNIQSGFSEKDAAKVCCPSCFEHTR